MPDSRERFENARLALDALDQHVSDSIKGLEQSLSGHVSMPFVCVQIEPFNIRWGKVGGLWQFHDSASYTPVLSMPRLVRRLFWRWIRDADIYALAADAYEKGLKEFDDLRP